MKPQDKRFVPCTLGHQRLIEQWRVPALGSLSRGSQKPGQVSRRGEPLHFRWEFRQKRRGRERDKERDEVDTGEARFPINQFEKLVLEPGPSFIVQKKLFILLVVHRDQWIIQNYAASAALTLIQTRLSLCIPSCIHKSQVIYIIFWPEGQLTFYGLFLIRVHQPENLFALIVLFLPKTLATLRKH